MNLKTLYKYFAQHKESSWIMKPYNAVALYKFVKENPIKRVLELGTGIGLSASVVALALKDKGETDYEIDTIEQYDKCIHLAKELIPKELQEKINIIKANPVVFETPLIARQFFSVYDQLPEKDYDLIINDGPSPFMEGEHYVDLPNGTIIQLLLADKLKKGTLIAYDGRLNSLALIERYFSDNFLLTLPSNKNDLNIIERKDNPMLCLDTKLENMKAFNYFQNEKENLPSDNRHTPPGETTSSHTGA